MATVIKPRQVPGVNRFEFVSNFKPAAAHADHHDIQRRDPTVERDTAGLGIKRVLQKPLRNQEFRREMSRATVYDRAAMAGVIGLPAASATLSGDGDLVLEEVGSG